MDVAAAAVKLAHLSTGEDGKDDDIVFEPTPGADRASRPGSRRPPRGAPDGNSVRLFVNAGRRAGIRPGDLVGAITGEAGVPADALGSIEIADNFSLVEVPELLADEIVAAMRKATLRGQKVMIRRDRDA